jgi:hypothetical protein
LVAYSHGEKESIADKNIRNIKPKSGWNSLSKSLLDLGALSLPHEDDLPGYSGCGADGISYDFEWATQRKYRFYSYCNPEHNVKGFWQAQNVLKIADLLEKEFSFKYIK